MPAPPAVNRNDLISLNDLWGPATIPTVFPTCPISDWAV